MAEALFAAAAVAYLAAFVVVRRRGRWWPPWRAACWLAGLLIAAAALTGPIPAAAHHDFAAHMGEHLLAGMVAPLFLVPGAPVTLALRALPLDVARGLSRVLASPPVRILTHPVTALVLNAGGLAVLYTTGLYPAMAAHRWLAVLVHVHFLVSGYLFVAAVISVDPTPHRASRPLRAAVLVGFLAAHAILAKYVYGHPPAGVLPAAGQAGAQLMYYGGDLVDLVLVALFCRQWYLATDPYRRKAAAVPNVGVRRPWRYV